MLESLFNKVAGLKASTPTLLKETPTQVFSCEICKIFQSTYFEEHLRTTACNDSQKKHDVIDVFLVFLLFVFHIFPIFF